MTKKVPLCIGAVGLLVLGAACTKKVTVNTNAESVVNNTVQNENIGAGVISNGNTNPAANANLNYSLNTNTARTNTNPAPTTNTYHPYGY